MTRLPITCPTCKRTNDLHDHPDRSRPSHGDYGLCWGCREPFRFMDDGGVLVGVKLTPDERELLELNDQYVAARHAALESSTPQEANALRREVNR